MRPVKGDIVTYKKRYFVVSHVSKSYIYMYDVEEKRYWYAVLSLFQRGKIKIVEDKRVKAKIISRQLLGNEKR